MGTALGSLRSSPPVIVSLLALTLGGLAIGTTEFASMSVLPLVAGDLAVSLPTASEAISVYALGVIVGAPTFALLGARWNRRILAVLLAAMVSLANLSTALAGSLPQLLASRFISGLPHGAYFGTVAVLGASLVPPERRGRAIATTMSGLMAANILGVPFATWLGQHLGWRSCYVAVAGVAALGAAAVVLLVPSDDSGTGAQEPPWAQLAALRHLGLLLTLATICVGFGGMFAVYTFIDPVMEQAGVPSTQLPLIVMGFGVGMTVGNWVGGHLADRSVVATIFGGLLAAMLVQVAFLLVNRSALGAVTTFCLLGFVVIATTPALNARLMDVAGKGRDLAAALYHAAFNVANGLGAGLGGVSVEAGLGFSSPAAVGVLLALLGLGLLAASLQLSPARPVQVGTGAVQIPPTAGPSPGAKPRLLRPTAPRRSRSLWTGWAPGPPTVAATDPKEDTE